MTGTARAGDALGFKGGEIGLAGDGGQLWDCFSSPKTLFFFFCNESGVSRKSPFLVLSSKTCQEDFQMKQPSCDDVESGFHFPAQV